MATGSVSSSFTGGGGVSWARRRPPRATGADTASLRRKWRREFMVLAMVDGWCGKKGGRRRPPVLPMLPDNGKFHVLISGFTEISTRLEMIFPRLWLSFGNFCCKSPCNPCCGCPFQSASSCPLEASRIRASSNFYQPAYGLDRLKTKVVERSGFEPLTPCMPCKCSTN